MAASQVRWRKGALKVAAFMGHASAVALADALARSRRHRWLAFPAFRSPMEKILRTALALLPTDAIVVPSWFEDVWVLRGFLWK
jgi:hypothetical protein